MIDKTSIMSKKIVLATFAVVFVFGVLSISSVVIGVLQPWQRNTTTDKKDINQYLDLTEDEFLAVFHLPEVSDPEERLKRIQALKEHQKAVLEHNKAYLAGERTWFEGINEFSDLPDDEFIASHTGLIEDPEQVNKDPQPVVEKSLMSSLPASYDSVSQGHVSPVKSQGGCGSSVAFATVALLETCFKKAIGMFGDYSEQHLLDCAYEQRGIYDNFPEVDDEAVPFRFDSDSDRLVRRSNQSAF